MEVIEPRDVRLCAPGHRSASVERVGIGVGLSRPQQGGQGDVHVWDGSIEGGFGTSNTGGTHAGGAGGNADAGDASDCPGERPSATNTGVPQGVSPYPWNVRPA